MKLIILLLIVTLINCAPSYKASVKSHFYKLRDGISLQLKDEKIEMFNVKRYHYLTYNEKEIIIDMKKNVIVFKGDVLDGLPYLGTFYYENIYNVMASLEITSI